MVSRIAAFVIWAAVAASAVFWALRFGARPTAVPAHAAVVGMSASVNGDLERLFGADAVAAAPAAVAVAAPADPRFRLIGVVAPRAAGAGGLALIALDDKPARAFRVGAAVDGDMVLQAVHARGATLGPPGQSARVDLQLPALPPPATGVPGMGGAVVPPPMPVAPGIPGRPSAVPLPAPAQSEEAQDEPPANIAPPGAPAVPPPTSPGRSRTL